MHRLYITIFAIIGLCLAGCGNGKNAGELSSDMEYARWLEITPNEGYTTVTVKNPWRQGAVLQTYLLVPHDSDVPTDAEGVVVRTPLHSVLVYSSVHGGAINELGELQSITGVCDLQYFDMPEIQQGVAEGRIVDAGNSMQPTIEKVVQLHPDAILLSPFQNSGYGALTNLDIPIIECADSMENTPL